MDDSSGIKMLSGILTHKVHNRSLELCCKYGALITGLAHEHHDGFGKISPTSTYLAPLRRPWMVIATVMMLLLPLVRHDGILDSYKESERGSPERMQMVTAVSNL